MKTPIILILLLFSAINAKAQFTGNPWPDFSNNHSMKYFDHYVKEVVVDNKNGLLFRQVGLQRKISIVGNYSLRNVVLSGGWGPIGDMHNTGTTYYILYRGREMIYFGIHEVNSGEIPDTTRHQKIESSDTSIEDTPISPIDIKYPDTSASIPQHDSNGYEIARINATFTIWHWPTIYYSRTKDSVLYQNDNSIHQMIAEFEKTYQAAASLQDFFCDSIYFTEKPHHNIDSAYFLTCKNLVKNRDTTALGKWLRSPVPEVQMYALQGFYELKKAGVTPSKEDMVIIKAIRKKHGDVLYYDGTDEMTLPIKTILKKFDF